MKTGICRKIDVHKTDLKYQKAREILESDKSISLINKAHIQNFLDDCQLGKTVLKRAKKKIKPNRLIKYLYTLKQIDRHLKKDFKKISQKEMEKFITKVDTNSLCYLTSDGKAVPRDYAEWTRHDIKVTLKKFYKWLMGENKEYPKIVSWIDTHVEEGDPPALTIDEIRVLADYAHGPKRKAMVWVLFETGGRASEFLNIRLCHVTDKDSYFLVRIEFPKTFKRTIPIYEGQNYLRDWLATHPQKDQPDAQLFPVNYNAFLRWLKRLGKKSLGKSVNLQLLRHSYATWLASKKVGRYQMCKLMGWAMSSDMPDKYIDRQGVVEEETLKGIRGDELAKTQSINSELKKELSEVQMKYSQIIEQLEHKKKSDNFLEKLIGDKEVQRMLCQKIRDLGIESQFKSL